MVFDAGDMFKFQEDIGMLNSGNEVESKVGKVVKYRPHQVVVVEVELAE